jgi:hypothetical protein
VTGTKPQPMKAEETMQVEDNADRGLPHKAASAAETANCCYAQHDTTRWPQVTPTPARSGTLQKWRSAHNRITGKWCRIEQHGHMYRSRCASSVVAHLRSGMPGFAVVWRRTAQYRCRDRRRLRLPRRVLHDISSTHKEHRGRKHVVRGAHSLLLQVHAWKRIRYQHAQG